MAGLRMRWVLNALIRRLMPLSVITRCSRGCTQLSNTTSHRYSPPIVWYLAVAVTPGAPFSTSTQPMPAPPGTLSTRVNTTIMSAMSARLIRVFTPLITTFSPSMRVFVR